MSDRPIIFSAPMVRALLDGRKTQTRRVLKKRPALDALATFGPSFLGKPGCSDLIGFEPYDRLWVRENFAMGFDHDDHDMRIGDEPKPFYAASYDGMRWYDPDHDELRDEPRWKPSIHMPRWASRLTLAVTGVKVERLNEISRSDAIAEGCDGTPGHDTVCDFSELWESLHGEGSWDANPWVVAITFTVHHRNIDAMEKAA